MSEGRAPAPKSSLPLRWSFLFLHFGVRHWLAGFNVFMAVFATLPLAVPLMQAAGWSAPAQWIFDRYSLVCHQMASRSYFILGHQMAYCERNTAIYGTMALAGLLWIRFGGRVPRLHWLLFGLLNLPMAIDGFTQLFGWRESTWELRTITGTLFGLAVVWFGFPLMERNAAILEPALAQLGRVLKAQPVSRPAPLVEPA